MLLREEGRLLGYARVLDDDAVWRIGRVVLARGGAWPRPGRPADAWPRSQVATGRDVVLDAQTPLAGWYATFGFTADGDEFLEDGIPHTPMRLSR